MACRHNKIIRFEYKFSFFDKTELFIFQLNFNPLVIHIFKNLEIIKISQLILLKILYLFQIKNIKI